MDALICRCSSASFSLEYAQTYMMQMIGQRIMFDMRMQIYATCSGSTCVLRQESGRPADDARHHRRRRHQRSVHVGRGARFGDCSCSSASWSTLSGWTGAGAHRFLGAAADRRARAVVPAQRARVVRKVAAGSRASTRSSTSTSTAWRRCSCSGARALNFGRFDDINRKHRDANVEQIFFYAVFLPAVEFVAAIAPLIIWYGGGFVMAGR
jgi:hypothetical protein